MRKSVKITSKIEDRRKQVYRDRGESPKFHHVVVSTPDIAFGSNRNPDDAFFELVKGVMDRVSVGLEGGIIAIHPYEGKEEDDRGDWKDRLFSGREWDGDVREELEERMHAHVICLADSVDHYLCESLHEQTGILVSRFEKDDSNVSLYGKQDLANATTYALSHARVAGDADAYRYFGAVANHAASDATEAEMRQVVRSVVPTTLGLDVADLTCDRGGSVAPSSPTGSASDSEAASVSGSGSGSGSATASDPHIKDRDGEAHGPCNGRLRPIPAAASALSDDDLLYADLLERIWTEWRNDHGDPPPD